MSFISGLSKLEFRVLTVSVLGLSVCGLLLSNEAALRWLEKKSDVQVTRHLKLAVADNVRGLVKILPVGRTEYELVDQKRELLLGDAVHVPGDAQINFKLDQGARVYAMANSLFRFAEFSSGDLVSLDLGHFRVEVDTVNLIALRGQPYEFSGGVGQLEVHIAEDGPPRIEAVSGNVHVVNLEKSSALPVPEGIETEVSQLYIWKFEDLYQKLDQWIRIRPEMASEVSVSHELAWNSKALGPFKVQISPDPQFSSAKKVFLAPQNNFRLETLWIGENFWRVSADSRRWSSALMFRVEPRSLDVHVSLTASPVGADSVRFGFSSETPFPLYVLEVSALPSFTPGGTTVWVAPSSGQTQKFPAPGKYYARVRGLNTSQELTEYSDVVQFQLEAAPRAPAAKPFARGSRAKAK